MRFYKKKIHFGFTIAGNTADFRINPRPNSLLPDTVISNSLYRVKSVRSQSQPGFAIGLVTDVRLQEYVRLRFTPNISFGTRKIQYTLNTPDRDSAKIFEKTVESVFLIFPMETKIQSKRLGNFSAYVIGGGGYSLDLSARKKAGSSAGGANQLDDNVKLLRDDFFYSAGAGTDFYLQYFKLGFELKLLIGTRDLLKHENSVFTNSIDKIRSRMVVFSITFEG
ncbi:MAG: outer membrane beta-barrel protein [Bacteroidetes bacterium]|nr:outer membrane beta-barrel protein [Bacteroidota bacterium]